MLKAKTEDEQDIGWQDAGRAAGLDGSRPENSHHGGGQEGGENNRDNSNNINNIDNNTLDATAPSESFFSFLFFFVCDRGAVQEEPSLGCREMLL